MLQSRRPSISVIIPTKDRAASLARAVELLLDQTVRPDQLIVVDQSAGDEGRRAVEALCAGAAGLAGPPVDLVYLLDPSIGGAAVARNVGMSRAMGRVWLFLDDDMEPEARFVEELLRVYVEHPEVSGVSGVITNYARPGLAFRLWCNVFLRGPFHDERQPIYWRARELRDSPPIRVTKFGSGLMSFRADVVRDMRFDGALRGVPPGEDIDFCARLGERALLVIAPRARIGHAPSPVGRSGDYWIKEYAQGKLYAYHRNWRSGLTNRLLATWFQVGCALVAVVGSVRRGSAGPWRAYRQGVRAAMRLGGRAPSARRG
jgi:glycosyltransferase involved in cell wall biosynthesis